MGNPPQAEPAPAQNATQPPEITRYILITQCLQNGFFLSADNRLCLPEEEVYRMLIGNQPESEVISGDEATVYAEGTKANRFGLAKDYTKGPLYTFLNRVIDKKQRTNELHVIHIRDWHKLSARYDEERRLYGRHCEAHTWEAEPLTGYDKYLKPWGDGDEKMKQRTLEGYRRTEHERVRFYEVLSDSVYDFKRSETIEHAPEVEQELRSEQRLVSASHLSLLMDKLLKPDAPNQRVRTYVVVIGVYTDIKIKTLLMGLRSRYNIDNLIVSDVLTAAPTLERSLEALDFFDKVLTVEIISNLNSLVSILDDEEPNSEEEPIPAERVDYSREWRKYRSYFQDQQNVLAYQDQQLTQYLHLAMSRSRRLYERLNTTNVWLQRLGLFAIVLLLGMVAYSIFSGSTIPLEAYVFTGIASLGGIIPNLITGPQEQMQKNLLQLVRLRNYLESYSITTALLRHHLTAPNVLENHDMDELRKQLDLIARAAQAIGQNFEDLGTLDEIAPAQWKPAPPTDDAGAPG